MVEVEFTGVKGADGSSQRLWLRVEDLSIGTSEYAVHTCNPNAAKAVLDEATADYFRKRCKA